MPATADLLSLGEQTYVSLTTFRRSGEGVSTAVWVARDGDALSVITGGASGKVKRLRNDPRVELRPCDRAGKVDPGAPVATGVAALLHEPEARKRGVGAIRRAYGWQFFVVQAMETVFRRGTERAVLRITPV